MLSKFQERKKAQQERKPKKTKTQTYKQVINTYEMDKYLLQMRILGTKLVHSRWHKSCTVGERNNKEVDEIACHVQQTSELAC